MKITKRFKFEMAHKLHKSYTCKCMNIHGHSYCVDVTIEGIKNQQSGVVIDFTEVKERIKFLIDDLLDHTCLISVDDPIVGDLTEAAGLGYTKVGIFSTEPTAENIAVWLLKNIKKEFINYPLHKFSVCLWETATSSVEVSEEDLQLNDVKIRFFGYGKPYEEKEI